MFTSKLLKACTKRAPLNASRIMLPSGFLMRSPLFMISASMPMRGFAYHERVIDHYENPRNVGSLDKNAVDVGTGLVGAPACGDVMKL